jgi:hypothetical protein
VGLLRAFPQQFFTQVVQQSAMIRYACPQQMARTGYFSMRMYQHSEPLTIRCRDQDENSASMLERLRLHSHAEPLTSPVHMQTWPISTCTSHRQDFMLNPSIHGIEVCAAQSARQHACEASHSTADPPSPLDRATRKCVKRELGDRWQAGHT